MSKRTCKRAVKVSPGSGDIVAEIFDALCSDSGGVPPVVFEMRTHKGIVFVNQVGKPEVVKLGCDFPRAAELLNDAVELFGILGDAQRAQFEGSVIKFIEHCYVNPPDDVFTELFGFDVSRPDDAILH